MSSNSYDVIVVGAGVAGLSAAEALSRAGARVAVLDRRPYVGGRAYSYMHPTLGEVVDSQHVIVECCANVVDLAKRSGADQHLRWFDRIPFLEPSKEGAGPRLSYIGSGALPAPAHASWSFLTAKMLSAGDKLAIAQSLLKFLRSYPQTDEEPFSAWIARENPSDQAIRHFWHPLVVATLNDSFERSSTKYAGQVFHELFLKSSTGSRQGVPTIPLSEFYGYFARLAEQQGSELHLRASVDRIAQLPDASWQVTSSTGEEFTAPNLVLAIPFEQTAKLLRTLPEAAPQRANILPHLEHFEYGPYTTVHLWYDRPITELEQAGLLDSSLDWMFNKAAIRAGDPSHTNASGHYYELSIAASFDELHQSREQILADTLAELPKFFPGVLQAKLLKSGVLKEAKATFSVLPGLDAHRPNASDPGGGVFLAGDWTRTGWPSTMEGAARSGRLAAEAIATACGAPRSFLAPELPASGLMRWIL
ncbi:zeta-carotene desaturase [Bryocella elongata]|uniref:Zeta-carotene desaturase n=1 Tax=Bryocella elongata TaxID=863522 RepID=A0A1H5TNN3_9BACT|nr:hydroxysqualene dehydroxylase HpnE [Bryocella elongata]SEF64359.1 zeta-carotene desaturase [Bryocella elongata]